MINKYVSIDIETTSLEEADGQVIAIGAVVDDLETPIETLPMFECYVDHQQFFGGPFALSMHAKIFREIAMGDLSPVCVVPSTHALKKLRDWLRPHFDHDVDQEAFLSCIPVAGKNYASFDLPWMKQTLPSGERYLARTNKYQRPIDVGNLYWRPDLDGFALPDTKTCMERAGIAGEVAHTALDDALVVVKLVRHWLESR